MRGLREPGTHREQLLRRGCEELSLRTPAAVGSRPIAQGTEDRRRKVVALVRILPGATPVEVHLSAHGGQSVSPSPSGREPARWNRRAVAIHFVRHRLSIQKPTVRRTCRTTPADAQEPVDISRDHDHQTEPRTGESHSVRRRRRPHEVPIHVKQRARTLTSDQPSVAEEWTARHSNSPPR